MPKTKISEYSATANSNTDVASINIDEGCAPSGINNAIRAIMGHLKDFQSGTSNDPFTVGSSGSLTLSYGTANGVAYLNGSKVLTTGSALTWNASSFGIGTTPLTNKLAVVGDTTNYGILSSNPSGYGGINIRSNTITAQTWSFIAQDNGANSDLLLYGGSSAGTKLTIDSSGNLGLGVTPSAWDTLTAFQIKNGSVYGFSTSDVSIGANNYYGTSNFRYITSSVAAGKYTISGNQHAWYIAPSGTAGNAITFTQAMTLDASGNLLVGTTSVNSVGVISVDFLGQTKQGITLDDTWASTGGVYILFRNSAGDTAGRIDHNGTTTVAYTTSSDYRLKENIAPMTGALAKVLQLNPVTYKWKSDGTDGQGFIAHELQAIVPDAVVGAKDAMNEDGSINPQGIDTSFLVATLTAAIQEQQALITQLTDRITALEAT